MSELLIMYLVIVKPFDNFLDNWIEIVNEITILLIFIISQSLIHSFPESITPEMKDNLGDVMIAVIALCMIFNIYFFLQNMFKTLVLN